MDYYSLKVLNVWVSPSGEDIAKLMASFLKEHQRSQLYFIDATNSFPLSSFQSLVPVEKKRIYDNIRIMACSDLEELSVNINKTIQVHTVAKFQKESKDLETLILINGIQLMHQNTQYINPSESQNLLNSILLRLRLGGNKDDSIKTILTFTKDSHPTKRMKLDGNTILQYIRKYYSDLEI